MNYHLNFHNHTILIGGNEEAVLKKLKEEFHFFLHEGTPFPMTTVNINLGSPPEIPSLVASKVLPQVSVYDLGNRKFLDYGGKALIIWDRNEATVKIWSNDAERLYELAFLSIHSILGQELDERGLCRIHALGVSLNNINALIMLSSGGGKSTLLVELLKNETINIISDDMPLIDIQGRAHPFPSKIALSEIPSTNAMRSLDWTEFKRTQWPPKWTAGLSQLSNRIEIDSQHKRILLIQGLRLSNGPSILEKVPKYKMIPALLEHMVVGIGLPQVLEMFLNFDITDIFKLIKHGTIRIICASRLLIRSETFNFYMGPGVEENAKTLLELMNERQKN